MITEPLIVVVMIVIYQLVTVRWCSDDVKLVAMLFVGVTLMTVVVSVV
jgi:hypothetical protein